VGRLRATSWYWVPPLVALLLFAAVALSDSDNRLFLTLNRAGQALGEGFWVNLTMLGDGAVVLALVLPCIRRSPRCFWAALVAAVIVTVWVHAFKQASHVPRPLAVFGPGRFHLAGPGYRAVSFPSGHAAAIFTLVGIWVLGLAPRPLVRLLLLVLAALVGLSRVMVGVHWPLDILWGMLGGWLAAAAALALVPRLGWSTSGPAGLAAGCVLLSLAAALLFSRHIGIPAVLPLQRVLGAVCLVWGAAEILQMLTPLATCWRPRRLRRGRRYPKGTAISRGRIPDSRESGNTIPD
jgi:membrane-associated phospholipid phosphatase